MVHFNQYFNMKSKNQNQISVYIIFKKRMLPLLVFFSTILAFTNPLTYNTIYQPKKTQIIIEQHQGTLKNYWLYVIKQQGIIKLKRIYYHYITKKIHTQTMVPEIQNFVLQGFDKRKFTCIGLANQIQTNITVYEFQDIQDTDLIDDNENGNKVYSKSYDVNSEFIPPKGTIQKFVFASYCVDLQINNDVIQSGQQKYTNQGWKSIIGNDRNFYFLMSENGLYYWSGVNWNIIFDYNISSDYQCEITRYDNSEEDTNERALLYCVLFSQSDNFTGYSWFVHSYLRNIQYPVGILLDQLSGSSLQKPQFKLATNLQKFVLTGIYPNNTNFIFLKIINYNDFIFEDIKVPSDMLINKLAFEINDNHLFVRNTTISKSKFAYSFFTIVNTQLILLNQSYLTQSQITSLFSIAISYFQDEQYLPGSYGQIVQNTVPVLSFYLKNTTGYYLGDTMYDSLKSLKLLEDSKVSQYQFNYPKANGASVQVYNTDANKWIYSYAIENDTKTIFFLVSYSLNFTTNLTVYDKYSIKAFSKGQNNCILAKKAQQNILLSIVFNTTTKKLQILQNYEYDSTQLDLSFSSASLIDSCNAFSFVSNGVTQIWRKNTDSSESPIYEKDINTVPLINETSFDPTFRYGVNYKTNSTYFYQSTNKTFINIFNKSQLFYTFNILYVDSTNKKIIILSRNQTTGQNNVVVYLNRLIVLQKVNNTWALVFSGFETTSTDPVTQFKFSQNFQIVAYHYVDKAGLKLSVFQVDYSKNTVVSISSTAPVMAQVYSKEQPLYYELTNKYFYLKNSTNQVVLNLLNSSYKKIILQNRIDSIYKLIPQKVRIFEQNTTANTSFYLIYQRDQTQSLKKIVINKRTLKQSSYDQNIMTYPRGVFLSSDNKVFTCPAGCQYCFDRYLCRKCFDGFYLLRQTKLCRQCGQNCKTCSQQKVSQCLSCFPNYVLMSSLCKRCHSNCYECSSPSQNRCLSCKTGWSLISLSKRNNTCIQCPSNCSACQIATKCKQCDIGYTVDTNGFCVICPYGCNKCNSSALSSCLQCKYGFFSTPSINPAQKITCNRCSDNCKVCISATNCTQCNIWYRLKSVNISTSSNLTTNTTAKNITTPGIICVVMCKSPCKQCSQTNSTECLSCVQGYVYNSTSKKCDFDINCTKYSNCTNCPYEYNLLASQCFPCQSNSKCDSCYKFNFQKCLSCKAGYYLLEDQCVPCSAECQQCIFDNICTKCKAGYLIQLNKTTSKCTLCSQNCKTCLYYPANCLSCKENMKLYGSRCISNLKVDFAMTLDYDIKNFTNKDYEGITNQIIAKTGKKKDQLTIVEIKSGSVVVVGNLLVANQNDQTSTLSTLRNSFAEGSTVNGKKIASSSFVGALAQPVVTQQTPVNIKLIIAIVVPVTVVVIAIIIFIIYRLRKAARQEMIKRVQKDDKTTQSGVSQLQREKRKAERAAKKNAKNLPQTQRMTSSSSEIYVLQNGPFDV